MAGQPPKRITVTVRGGVVVDVQGIPEDTVVVVHDYDIDGWEDGSKKDEYDRPYLASEWTKEN